VSVVSTDNDGDDFFWQVVRYIDNSRCKWKFSQIIVTSLIYQF